MLWHPVYFYRLFVFTLLQHWVELVGFGIRCMHLLVPLLPVSFSEQFCKTVALHSLFVLYVWFSNMRGDKKNEICPDLSTSGGLEWQWHYSTSSREGRIENLIILLSLLFRIFTLRMIEIWCTKVHRDITISCFILR